MKYINTINDDAHYFTRTSIHYDSYMHSLNTILNSLKEKVGEKKINRLIREKLQVRAGAFDESQYIQAACELTVMGEFIDFPEARFVYEDKITPPKDVDLSIVIKGKKYNIEVKCASYKEEVKSPDEVVLYFSNRMPSVELREEALRETRQRLMREGINVIEGKNLDNVMKDFLESTQAKVKNRKAEDTNILVVCCNGEVDMQLWRGYLFGEGGFFTEESPVEHERFDDVDFVLLTNIYNRHFRYFNDQRVSKHWSLSSSFNLLYPNRYSRKNKRTTVTNSQNELKELNGIFLNHNIKFEEYMKQEKDVPSGEDGKLKSILGVAWYADKFKGDSVFYFKKHLPN